MLDKRVVAGLFFVLILILAERKMTIYRNLMLRQFLLRRRLFMALSVRLQQARRIRNRRRMWAYQRPQHWLEEMLNNRVLHSLWKKHFRVSRGTFDYICGIVSRDIQRQNTRLRQVIPVQKRVAVALWRLGSGNSFRSTAITFGIGKSSVVKIFHSFSEAINRRMNEFTSFPVVEIKAPLVNPADYFNRKQKYLVVMFMDVSTGFRAAYSKTLQ